MVSGELKITRRRLPHWSVRGATYFVTFRTQRGVLSETERTLVLNHVKQGANQFYTLVACVVMPNHIHVIFSADRSYSLEQIMRGMKGVSAYKVNETRGTEGEVWQHESFDRIIRSQKELYAKLRYMLNNSLKARLVEDPWGYTGWYCNEEYFRR